MFLFCLFHVRHSQSNDALEILIVLMMNERASGVLLMIVYRKAELDHCLLRSDNFAVFSCTS